MTIGITHFLVLSAALFGIGLVGLCAHRSPLRMLMAVEVMLSAAVVAVVGIARFGFNAQRPMSGMALALLAILGSATEVTVGVAIVVAVARRRGSLDADSYDELHG